MSSLPHILFICSWYPHEENSTHGIFIKRHAECVATTHKVSVVFAKSVYNVTETTISVNEVGNLTEIIILYPKISTTIPLLKNYLKFKHYNNAIIKGLRIAEESQNIDIIHLQVIFPAAIPTLKIIKKLKKPLIITEHWTGYAKEDGSYNGFLKTFITKKIISKATYVIVISDYLKNIMMQQNLKANYCIIPNIVDTALFKPLPQSPHKGLKFIHVSSLDDRQKNITGIIRSFSKAYQLNNQLTLSIVGDGDNKDELIGLTKEVKVDNAILFKGKLSAGELAMAINEHDALVMFSNYETFCLAVAETLACGKPVITTDVGGIKEYMNSERGIVIEQNNEEQLAQALLTFNPSQFNCNDIRNFALKQFNKNTILELHNNLYRLLLA